MTVIDSIIADNAKAGFYASGTSVPYVRVSIDRSSFDNDGTGVQAGDYARITVRNSEASGNQVGFAAQTTSGAAQMNISQSMATNNSIAGVSASSSSGTAAVRVQGMSVFNNGTGFQSGPNGTITSFGNNYNTGTGAPSTTLAPQ